MTTPRPSHVTAIYMTGDPVTTTEQLTDIGGGTLFEAPDAKDIFDPTASITVREDANGANTTVTSGYVEQYLLGRIKFDTAPTTPVEIDYSYLPIYKIAEVFAFEWSAQNNLNNTPRLSDKGERRSEAQYDFTGSFDSYEFGQDTLDASGNEDTFADVVRNGRLVVLEFRMDTSVTDVPTYISMGRISTKDDEADSGSQVQTTYNFESSQFTPHPDNLTRHENYDFKEDTTP